MKRWHHYATEEWLRIHQELSRGKIETPKTIPDIVLPCDDDRICHWYFVMNCESCQAHIEEREE